MSEPRVTTRRGLLEILRGKPPERGHWIKVTRGAGVPLPSVLDVGRHVEDARARQESHDRAALTWFRE